MLLAPEASHPVITIRPAGANEAEIAPGDTLLLAETQEGQVAGSLWLQLDWLEANLLERQGFIRALQVAPEHRRLGIGRALLTEAMRWTRLHGLSHLAAWLPAEQADFARACGASLERHWVVADSQELVRLPYPPLPELRIGLATPRVVPAIAALAPAVAEFGIPHARQADREAILARWRADYLENLDHLLAAPQMRWLVAERRRDKELQAFVMLQANAPEPGSSDGQMYLGNIAVVRQEWGQGLAFRLTVEAARTALTEGFKKLWGWISCDNLRSLQAAERSGFSIRGHQVSWRLD